MLQEAFESYRKVYRMLEDEESRETYLNRLMYLISDDYKYIRNVLTSYVPNIPPLSGTSMEELLSALPKDRGIVLYGTGDKGAQIIHYFQEEKRFIGFCGNNPKKQEEGYLGYPVMSPEELLQRKDLTVLVGAPRSKGEIMRSLKAGKYPEDQIIDLDTIAAASDPKQYFSPDFIAYEDEEVFVDAGCFDLATSLDMRKYCKYLKKVYAFEPDPENYKNCLYKKEQNDFSEAEIFPFGTWSERRTIAFSAEGTGASLVSENGEDSVEVVPIDEVIHPEDRITFIKMDVEGAELESLKGAVKTIQKDRPKLAICIYHKPEDMVEIPLFIKQLVPEYRLYVRLHANDGSETVLYAIPPRTEIRRRGTDL